MYYQVTCKRNAAEYFGIQGLFWYLLELPYDDWVEWRSIYLTETNHCNT